MNSQEVLQFCMNKGLLIDNEVLNLFERSLDTDSVKHVLEKMKNYIQTSVINKSVLSRNREKIIKFISDLNIEDKEKIKSLKSDLGLEEEGEIDIGSGNVNNSHSSSFNKEKNKEERENKVRVSYMPTFEGKNFELKDFLDYYKNRISFLRNILQEHSELEGLVSIDKLSNNRSNFSVVGMVSEKKQTKNGNFLFEIEDERGNLRVLVNQNKPDLFKKAEEVPLDSVIGFKGAGNKEILFANDIVFPDSKLNEKKKSPNEEYAAFIGDFHFGSKLFLKDSFMKFIKYINGEIPNTPESNKIKYLFLVGDIITGIGNYPEQENDLPDEMMDLEEQYAQLAELLGKIRKDVNIIISPGNHDGVRIMEPQPLFDEKFAWPLYNMENVILTTNPAEVNIGADKEKGFEGFNVLTYHGFSFPYYAKNIPHLIEQDAINKPEEIMKYLLKLRHLAPTNGSTQYFPMEEDHLIIRNVPDIFVAAHTHKSAVSNYKNTIVVSVSTWEAMTAYQEKMGNKPDHCKVPIINLKTGDKKLLDFEG